MHTIGIDYTPAYEQGGGIGRYVRELTAALAQTETPPDTAFSLFVSGYDAQSKQLPPLPGHFEFKTTRLSPKALARLWHRARVPLSVERFVGKVDLFHATDFVLPPLKPRTRSILTVHDLSYIHVPEAASPRLQRYLEMVVPRSISRANHILADSQATKADIINQYKTAPEKITVLYSGVDARFKPVTEPEDRIRQKYNLPDAPYIVSVGTVQPRKNYARLVQALAVLRQKKHNIHLVIAGGKGWLEDEMYSIIQQTGMEPYVHLIGYVDDDDLPALYSHAVLSAFPSLYEGFGLPILESMACGTPVITSNISSLPEVAGEPFG